MKINNSELETVAVKRSQYPVSGSPGKTRTINFYRCQAKSDDGETKFDFRIVDLPGYGFARISRSESEKWGEMMESYLEHREGLVKVVQLVDIRHKPSAQDVQMYEYLRYYGLDGIVVATKADKISNNERARNIKEIRKALDMGKGDVVIPVSALKKTGERELLAEIERLLAAGMEG